MTQDECENLLCAYEKIILLAESDTIRECNDLAAYADCAKDSLGEFIACLLSDSRVLSLMLIRLLNSKLTCHTHQGAVPRVVNRHNDVHMLDCL
jgi:hypothetical protein